MTILLKSVRTPRTPYCSMPAVSRFGLIYGVGYHLKENLEIRSILGLLTNLEFSWVFTMLYKIFYKFDFVKKVGLLTTY